MSKLFLSLAVALALLFGVVLARTLSVGPELPAVMPAAAVGVAPYTADRLAGAIRIATISHQNVEDFDASAFQALHEYLALGFPRVHAQLERQTIATHSLLYTWQGSDPSLRPILLAGHLDVVPVEPGTERQWQEKPFSGRIADGFIWGRGTIDNKSAVLGTMEAAEMLLGEGFRPARTVYFAYGHDEEVGGIRGARAIAERLKSENVELEMVLDEGGALTDRIVADLAAPFALVGVAEKGFVSVALDVRAAGGHSSLPPAESAIGILSEAITRLEANQMPARLEDPTRQLLERVAPALPVLQRAALANLWVTEPIVLRKLGGSPSTNAMVRTTTAVTIFQAGTKDNILPTRASAVVNFRVLPGDKVADVIQHVRLVVDDPRVEIESAGAFSAEPSTVSGTDSQSFHILERTIREIVPEAIVAPYVVSVATDARHYAELGTNVFRFLPVSLGPLDIERMHGTNERIPIREYERAIRFYRQLIRNASGKSDPVSE